VQSGSAPSHYLEFLVVTWIGLECVEYRHAYANNDAVIEYLYYVVNSVHYPAHDVTVSRCCVQYFGQRIIPIIAQKQTAVHDLKGVSYLLLLHIWLILLMFGSHWALCHKNLVIFPFCF